MTDIVERLRAFNYPPGNITHEAADEIVRLREWCRKLIEGGTFPGEGDDLRNEIERLRKENEQMRRLIEFND